MDVKQGLNEAVELGAIIIAVFSCFQWTVRLLVKTAEANFGCFRPSLLCYRCRNLGEEPKRLVIWPKLSHKGPRVSQQVYVHYPPNWFEGGILSRGPSVGTTWFKASAGSGQWQTLWENQKYHSIALHSMTFQLFSVYGGVPRIQSVCLRLVTWRAHVILNSVSLML